MTYTSFPVIYDVAQVGTGQTATDANLTGDNWDKIHRTMAGVDVGMAMVLNNATNTGIFASGSVVGYRGYVLVVSADHSLSIPTVSVPTTYSVGVRYDPTKYNLTGGPLSLLAGVKGTIDLSGGKKFWTLYEVDRTAAQTLELSPVRTYLVNRSSSGIYRPVTSLEPPAAEYELYTKMSAVTGDKIRTVSGATPVWSQVGLESQTGSSGLFTATGWHTDYQYWHRVDRTLSYALSMTRTSTTTISGGTTGDIGNTTIGTMSVGFRPWVPAAPFSLTGTGGVVGGYVSNTGTVVLSAIAPNKVITAGTVLSIAGTYLLA